MAVRSIKVWNASASAWEGVGIEMPEVTAAVTADDASNIIASQVFG